MTHGLRLFALIITDDETKQCDGFPSRPLSKKNFEEANWETCTGKNCEEIRLLLEVLLMRWIFLKVMQSSLGLLAGSLGLN